MYRYRALPEDLQPLRFEDYARPLQVARPVLGPQADPALDPTAGSPAAGLPDIQPARAASPDSDIQVCPRMVRRRLFRRVALP